MSGLFTFIIGLKSYLVLYSFYHSGENFDTLSTLLTVMLISILTYILFPQKAVSFFLFLNILYSFILFSNILYFRHFGDFWSISVFYYINQLKDVSGSIQNLFHYRDLLIFIDIPFLWFIYKTRKEWFYAERDQTSMIVKFSKWVMVAIFCFIVIGYNSISSIYPFESRNSNRHIVNTVGFVNYYLQDIYFFTKGIFVKETVTEEELSHIRQSMRSKDDIIKGDYFGIIQNQNVIYVQLESMSQYLINQKINGKEITPVLNRLIRENYSSPNVYKQVGAGHTSDAEYASLSGLYPLEKESVSVMYANNTFDTIPQLLKKEGYETISAHGYRKEFWNRQNAHLSYGFNQSWFIENYQMNQEQKGFIGLRDDAFYEQSIRKLAKVKKPFFAHLISLESHTPFDVREEDKELDVGELEGTILGKYLHSAHVADQSLVVLLNEMKKTGLDKNTTLVIFGDHDAELENKWIELYLGKVDKRSKITNTRVPFVIVTPNQELKGLNENVMGEIDIAPSILHLMGIVPEEPLFYGGNIFNPEQQSMVRLPQGNMITNDYLFLSEDGTYSTVKVIELSTGKEIKRGREWEESYQRMQREYHFSEKIIKSNLIEPIKKH